MLDYYIISVIGSFLIKKKENHGAIHWNTTKKMKAISWILIYSPIIEHQVSFRQIKQNSKQKQGHCLMELYTLKGRTIMKLNYKML